jgi:sec-independent protein translocase protein TatB
MFDIAPTELMLVGLIALVVIGPKDLPRAMRFVGKWMGKARGMARHFRSGIDTMMRESELEELEKQWRQQNEDIMRQYPRSDDPAPAAPLSDIAVGEDDPLPAASAPESPTPATGKTS